MADSGAGGSRRRSLTGSVTSHRFEEKNDFNWKPLLERLQELGYAEGKNMIFEYRSAEDDTLDNGWRSWPRNSCEPTRTC